MGSVPGSSATAASGITGAIGDIFGAFGQSNAMNVQAQIARNNAIIARQNASYAAEAGEAKTEQLGLRTRGQVAEITARQAGAGIDPNMGSSVDVRKSAAMLGNLDTLTARSAAARQAYGYQLDAATQDQNALMARKAAKLDLIGGIAGALGGSLLSKAVSLQGQYAQAQMEGISTNGGLPLDSIFGNGGGGGETAGSSASDYEDFVGGD